MTLSACALLSACLVPEKFTATATFNPDGTYLYQFDGTVVHAMVVMAEQKGPLSDRDRTQLQQDVKKFASTPGVKKFKTLSDSRYELSTEEVLPPEPRGMQGKSTDVFQVDNRELKTSRTLTVTGPRMSAKDRDGLKQLGIKLDGKVSVILPKGTKVLQHNASTEPGMFNKAYQWKVTSVTDEPMIKFQLPSQ